MSLTKCACDRGYYLASDDKTCIGKYFIFNKVQLKQGWFRVMSTFHTIISFSLDMFLKYFCFSSHLVISILAIEVCFLDKIVVLLTKFLYPITVLYVIWFVDINECLLTEYVKCNNGKCSNTNGSYVCICNQGFSSDGRNNCIGNC